MNGSDAHPASVVNKIIWSCYVALDSLISSLVLAGWASDPFMLPPCTVASEKDGFMSETMIKYRNLPNPHLFEPLFYTRA